MISASLIKLRCEAVRCSASLKNVLKTNIKTIDKTIYNSDDYKLLFDLCKKTGRVFFYNEKGEVECLIPIFSKKSTIFYNVGPFFKNQTSVLVEKEKNYSYVPYELLWEKSDCAVFTAKSISYEYAKTDYPDFFKNFENAVLMSLRMKNAEEFQNEINNILTEINKLCKNSVNLLKSATLTLFILLYKICSQNNINPKHIFGKNSVIFCRLCETKDLKDIKNILNEVFKKLETEFFGKISSKMALTDSATKYIKHHFSEKISLESVAREIFISPHYLSKVFLEEKGVNFNRYVNNIRIDIAKNMLKDDKNDVASVAKAVGFNDLSYFSKCFKKVVAMTPTEYKMKIRLMN